MSDESDASFRGLMKSLNLDDSKFKSYNTDFSKLTFDQLTPIKQDIEAQLSQLFGLLKQQYGVDMDTPLVSKDGFPRADIDVVSIRLIRVRIIRLRNDHKQLLSELENKMIAEFERRSKLSGANQEVEKVVEPTIRKETRQPISTHIPFAQVSEVVNSGPASNAGLKSGDKIVLFDGEIHAANHSKLSALATRVRNKVNKSIEVVVLRDSNSVTLQLVPTNAWEGQGLLGCRLVPL